MPLSWRMGMDQGKFEKFDYNLGNFAGSIQVLYNS